MQIHVSLKRASGSAAAFAAALALGWATSAGASDSEIQVDGMTFVASRDDVSEVVVHARSARFHTQTEIAELKHVRTTVASGGDRLGFEMECERGELDLDTNDFLAEGNVEGRTDGGREFFADWVRYDHAAGVLFTDAPVLIRDGTGTYRGGGFRYHVEERRFRLLGGARVVQGP